MLYACALDFQGSWDDDLPMVEFAYNNSYQVSIQMARFEAVYWRKCRTPTCWTKVGTGGLWGLILLRRPLRM